MKGKISLNLVLFFLLVILSTCFYLSASSIDRRVEALRIYYSNLDYRREQFLQELADPWRK